MGVNVYAQKMMVFVVSSAITAYGGALYAFNILFIEPNLFNWLESGKLIIITFVGGLNSIAGVIAASAIYYSFGEFFRFIDVWRDVLLAVVVILVIIFRPGGLFQGLELLPRRLRAQRKV
jgi:branched-chain amino acid transport system permease protein